MKWRLRVGDPYASQSLAWAAAAVLLCVALGVAARSPTQLLYALLAGLVVASIIVARSFENLLILNIWMGSLVHLLKRVIFLLGPQPQSNYYAVLAMPTVIYAAVLITAFPRIRQRWRERAAVLLMIYMVLGTVATLLTSEATWLGRAAAIHERILPMTAFLVGLTLPLQSDTFARVCRALLYSGALSVVYGVILYLNGPTVLEREWARHTAAYSIQGGKVWTYMVVGRSTGEWRGFSYYADPTTWGLFLVVAIAGLMIARNLPRGGVPAGSILVWLPLLLLGLFVSLTRTPWVGLMSMVGVYVMLYWRPAQRTWLPVAVLAGGFVFLIVFGNLIYERLMPSIPELEDPILRRYAALGTVVARTGAWQGLLDAAVHYPVMGGGFAQSDYITRSVSGLSTDDPGGHNFLLESVVYTGVPGLIIFLWFLIDVLRGGTIALRTSASPRAVAWLVAFVTGGIMTGFLNGGNFMTRNFFILAGALAAARLGEQPAPVERTWSKAPSAYSLSATRTWLA